MLSQVYWQTSNRVLVVKGIGTINLDDANAIKQVMDIVLSDANAHVHFLIDARDKDGLDPQLFKLRETVSALTQNRTWRGKPGWIIVVDQHPNPVMEFVTSIATQLIKAQFRVFRTMDEALTFLQHLDAQIVPTLPAEPENLLATFLQLSAIPD
ncbi:MAG: hypothetical protein SGI73_01960 [Chloroflexota bacterium]|nr:hypothetical protein [Chloroflexota bacterium]